jgi:hypothetical protein
MATRMTTLLDETEEVGNASMPPMRPIYPTPNPWLQHEARKPIALDSMMFGVAAAAAVLAGLATFAIAMVWAHSMSAGVRLTLMVIGGYLIAAGLAYVVSQNQNKMTA